METSYHCLGTTRLQSGCTYRQPEQALPGKIGKGDPAILAMTDLTRVAAITIQPDAGIDAANDKMIANSVRLLLVTDEHNCVLGIITAADILGEKPLQYLQGSGGERSAILVSHIMTSIDKLDALSMVGVAGACVGDIVATLKSLGRQHTIVVETDAGDNQQYTRGIFSATHIGKLLGAQIEPADIAKTFAEIEKIVNT